MRSIATVFLIIAATAILVASHWWFAAFEKIGGVAFVALSLLLAMILTGSVSARRLLPKALRSYETAKNTTLTACGLALVAASFLWLMIAGIAFTAVFAAAPQTLLMPFFTLFACGWALLFCSASWARRYTIHMLLGGVASILIGIAWYRFGVIHHWTAPVDDLPMLWFVVAGVSLIISPAIFWQLRNFGIGPD